MAGLFQGAPNPATTKTTEAQQTAPEFYTNYLQDIANLGQNAVQQGGIAGFSPLQQQAFQMAPDVAFSGAGSMGAASQLLGEAGSTTVPDVIADYMNPYTSSVVDEMGRLTNRNVQENILPNLGAAAVGSGQFGSRRQSQVTGNALRDIQSDLLGKQMQALQQGYTTAGTQAQTDLSRTLNAGQAFENLGQAQQGLGIAGLKTMSDFGAQQQAQGQKLLDYPMAQTQQFSNLLKNYNIPMGTTTQSTGSEGFQNSPLSQIAGLGTMFASLFPSASPNADLSAKEIQARIDANNAQAELNRANTAKVNKGASGGIMRKAHGGGVRLADGGMAPMGSEYHDGNGNFYDADGYLVG
jgi:hypothetical protein